MDAGEDGVEWGRFHGSPERPGEDGCPIGGSLLFDLVDILSEWRRLGDPWISGEAGKSTACMKVEKRSMGERLLSSEEKSLDSLPPTELGRRLMDMPASKRLDLVLRRPDAESVVAGLAEQDFFVTVKDIGADDAGPLLALGTSAQLNHLFDIEWWQKDSVLPANALDWLERLGRANEVKLLAWLYKVDFELLTVLFKRWIRVDVAPEDLDLLEARDYLPEHTLDDQFFWECRYPQYEALIERLLSLLFEAHQGFYNELMNHILWAVDAELEEAAYHFHRGRLEELGIPDFYDAVDIYRSLRPEERSRQKSWPDTPFDSSVPSFALALIPEGDLFHRALGEIANDQLLDLLRRELASLANKVVVADELPPDQPRALQRAVDKAAAYVNLGLTIRSGHGVSAAAAQLKQHFLEDLFRLGHEKVMQLRSRLQRIVTAGWLSRWPHGIQCLDSDWLEWAELLLLKTPQLRRRGSGAGEGSREDFFRSTEDLLEVGRQINVLITMGRIFDALWEGEGLRDWSLHGEGVVRGMADVTLGTMIWTAAARFLHERVWKLVPLEAGEWGNVWPALHPIRMEEAIRRWVRSVVKGNDQIELAELYVEPLIQDYAREMGAFFVEKGPTPDLRLMKCFLFVPESQHRKG
jgi:hypothetical protein